MASLCFLRPSCSQQLKASQQEDAGKDATKISVSSIMTSRKGSNGGHSCNLKKIFLVQYRRELGQEDGEEKQGGGGRGNGSDLFFKSWRFFKFIE